MTDDNDKTTIWDNLAKITLGETSAVDAQPTVNTVSIGTSANAVDLSLDEQTLKWLENTLKPDGKAFLNTVELQTAKGTIVLESNSVIRLSWGEYDD